MSENEKNAKTEEAGSDVKTKEELKQFLLNIRDKMADRTAAPIFAMAALNNVMNLSNIYELLDEDNKELARDIWLRLKQSGLQLRNPALLFSSDEEPGAAL